MLIPTILFILFLCWGSFLNVVGYRIIIGKRLTGRSECLHCQKVIAWYDLMPVISYLTLQGKCRWCQQKISWLYPFIELITALSLLALYFSEQSHYFIGYFVLFSALIVTIRSDLETMYISRWATIALVPIGIIFSFTDHIPIVPLNSIAACAFGFGSLWLIGTLFYLMSGKQGIGEGDYDLMALIGAFTGMIGLWATLLIGSILGSIIGIIYLQYQGALSRQAKVPFGPFLAAGAMIYVLLQDQLMNLLIGF